MRTRDARVLLKAMEVLDITDFHESANLKGIVLVALTDEHRVQSKPAQVTVTPDHPKFKALLDILNNAVGINKTAAQAKLAEFGVTRTAE